MADAASLPHFVELAEAQARSTRALCDRLPTELGRLGTRAGDLRRAADELFRIDYDAGDRPFAERCARDFSIEARAARAVAAARSLRAAAAPLELALADLLARTEGLTRGADELERLAGGGPLPPQHTEES